MLNKSNGCESCDGAISACSSFRLSSFFWDLEEEILWVPSIRYMFCLDLNNEYIGRMETYARTVNILSQCIAPT